MSIGDVYRKAVETLAKQGVHLEFIYKIQGDLKIFVTIGPYWAGIMLSPDELTPSMVSRAIQEATRDVLFPLGLSHTVQEVACAGS